jgi:single-strand DNA-binding protein
MARSLNQVTLMGNLTRDPELRQTPTGQNVTSFSLALNRSYKTQNGDWQEATDYIDIVAWGPLAERVSQYLSKGRRCLVQGRLQSRSWEQDGQKRSKVEVLAAVMVKGAEAHRQTVTYLQAPVQQNQNLANRPMMSLSKTSAMNRLTSTISLFNCITSACFRSDTLANQEKI